MARSRSSRSKVFVEEKKERKDKGLVRKLEEQNKEIAKLKREIEDLKASGKVPVVKEKVKKVIAPPKIEDLEKQKQEARDRIKKWRIETFGDYEEN